MQDRIPPQDIEAEQAVLGAMLIDEEAAGRVLEQLRAKIFIVKLIGLFLLPWKNCMSKSNL
jgi:replicative DNA helicase